MIANLGIGLVTALLMLTGVVRAANVPGGYANESSSVTANSSVGCGAAVSNVVAPSPLSVDTGDRVVFYHNLSWSDTRRAPASSATHYFHLRVAWAVTYRWDDWYNVTTTGEQSDSASMRYVITDEVYYEYNIDVLWEVTVVNGAYCSAYDAEERVVTLDL